MPGVLIDAPGAAEACAELLDGLELADKAVLFHTGWEVHWATDRYGEAGHPFLAVETAKALVDAGVSVVGIDSVNIDDTRGGERPIHTALLGAGIPIVEHLCRLDDIGDRAFTFTALPPAVVWMGTFPVRAVATVR